MSRFLYENESSDIHCSGCQQLPHVRRKRRKQSHFLSGRLTAYSQKTVWWNWQRLVDCMYVHVHTRVCLCRFLWECVRGEGILPFLCVVPAPPPSPPPPLPPHDSTRDFPYDLNSLCVYSSHYSFSRATPHLSPPPPYARSLYCLHCASKHHAQCVCVCVCVCHGLALAAFGLYHECQVEHLHNLFCEEPYFCGALLPKRPWLEALAFVKQPYYKQASYRACAHFPGE